MRRTVAAVLAGAVIATGIALVGAEPAVAATPRHIGVVVRYANGRVSAGCAKPSSSGLAVLEEHHNVRTGTQQYSGFVIQVDGVGATRPDDTHYWSYWHSNGHGGWTYAGSGAASSHPKAGTVEGWSYVNGQSSAPRPPSHTYAALCAQLDPSPRTASPAPQSSSPSSAHSSAQSSPPSSAQTSSPASAQPPSAPRSSASRASAAGSSAAVRSSSVAGPASSSGASPTSTASRAIATHSARATPSAASSPAARSSDAAHHSGSSTPHRSSPAAARSTLQVATLSDDPSSGSPSGAWPTIGALAVVAALGVTAWLVMRRRAG